MIKMNLMKKINVYVVPCPKTKKSAADEDDSDTEEIKPKKKFLPRRLPLPREHDNHPESVNFNRDTGFIYILMVGDSRTRFLWNSNFEHGAGREERN